jgi:hypothetical protein
MQRPRRRDVLRLLGATGAGLAGCLGDGPPASPGGTETPTGSTATTDPGGVASHETVQFGAETGQPAWYDEDSPGHAELYGSESVARTALALDGLPEDRRDVADQLLSETDFGSARVLFLGSVGPDTCHGEIAVGDLRTGDGRLLGRFEAHDPCGDCACGDAITYPSALVAVTFEGDPPDAARLTAVGGWDEAATVEVVADGGVAPDDLPGYVGPEREPNPVAALDCPDEGFTRHGTGFSGDVEWGEATDDDGNPTVALRVDQLGFTRGDTVTVTMTNVTDGEQVTGNRDKYNLQVYTEAGWQDVRGWTGDERGYTDEGRLHQPGEGFEWSLTLTEAGVVAGHPHAGNLTVCPGLPAGRYRFAFWEPAVAVGFDLLE